MLVPRLLGGLFHGSWFDIRLLAAVYGILLLAATWLLVKHNARGSYITGLLLAGALLFVFTISAISRISIRCSVSRSRSYSCC